MSAAVVVRWRGFETCGRDREVLRAWFEADLHGAARRVLLTLSVAGGVRDIQVVGLRFGGTTGDSGLDARLADIARRRLIAARDAAVVAEFDGLHERRWGRR